MFVVESDREVLKNKEKCTKLIKGTDELTQKVLIEKLK